MPHRLQRLQPQHHAAIRMRLEGLAAAAIAERLGVQRRTVYLWFGDPLVKAEIERQLAAVGEAFRERLAEAGMAALAALQELAVTQPDAGPTVEEKLQASRMILERAAPVLVAQAQEQDQPQPGTIHEMLMRMTPAQLDEMEWKAKAKLQKLERRASS